MINTIKVCSHCKIPQFLQEFSTDSFRKDGYCSQCKSCKIKYYYNNKEKSIIYSKNYKKCNKEKIKTYCLVNKEKITQRNKEWHNKNKDYWKQYYQNKRKNNKEFKIKNSISSLIHHSLKRKNYIKSHPTEQILGCNIAELKQHIELQFEPWMNWNNHGKIPTELNQYWDIDHIIPISSAKTEEEIIKLNHYTNLRPLCSYVNRWVKKDKIEKAK
jgi:hypothetical protein